MTKSTSITPSNATSISASKSTSLSRSSPPTRSTSALSSTAPHKSSDFNTPSPPLTDPNLPGPDPDLIDEEHEILDAILRCIQAKKRLTAKLLDRTTKDLTSFIRSNPTYAAAYINRAQLQALHQGSCNVKNLVQRGYYRDLHAAIALASYTEPIRSKLLSEHNARVLGRAYLLRACFTLEVVRGVKGGDIEEGPPVYGEVDLKPDTPVWDGGDMLDGTQVYQAGFWKWNSNKRRRVMAWYTPKEKGWEMLERDTNGIEAVNYGTLDLEFLEEQGIRVERLLEKKREGMPVVQFRDKKMGELEEMARKDLETARSWGDPDALALVVEMDSVGERKGKFLWNAKSVQEAMKGQEGGFVGY